jgi:hypothetical protein
MKKFLLFVGLFFLSVWNINAQSLADFENLSLPADSFWNGSDLSGGFTNANAFFSNTYNATYQSWGGFSYSNKSDSTTIGYNNMYASITGSGANHSTTYAVAFVSAYGGPASISFTGNSADKIIDGFYVNNNTYAYYSMRDGDSYSKKFGGATGNDSDWFMLTIEGHLNGNLVDTINFFLADFQFSDNSKDYIIHKWSWVDLSKLGNLDSISFSLTSSDNGTWGMNTPAYFCLDNLKSLDGVNISNSIANDFVNIYPNPSQGILHINSINHYGLIRVYNTQGQIVWFKNKTTTEHNPQIDLSSLSPGLYWIELSNNLQLVRKTIVIE